jgi:ribosomal protein S18 acetylase RimI-like enzyme
MDSAERCGPLPVGAGPGEPATGTGAEVQRVVQYRTFRNDDPPGLVEIWNETFTARGAAPIRNPSALERHTLAKPYFDPAGLIVAYDANTCVGFAHAGFGPNQRENALAYTTGVICLIGVRPAYRRQGVGTELMDRCTAYLRSKGARTIYAGSMRPYAPFYLGLYGGSDLPGFLASDMAAAPFLEYQGFGPSETCLVFQRRLDQPITVADGRFPALRRRFQVRMVPRTGVASWWQECVLGPLEPLEFRLEESSNGRMAARAEVWEMEGFSWRWGVPSAGVLSLQVREDLRRQGLGKFLLLSIIKYLQEQYFGILEVQAMERNQAAVKLVQSAGCAQVDFGRLYKRER